MNDSQHPSRINDVLYEIHRDISADLPAKKLAAIAAYSEQHFHRVFQKVVGESVHQYIRRTRLEQAANQLMFDPGSPVIDIANKCGFASLPSFTQAFKSNFALTPGQWRKQDTKNQPPPYLADTDIATAYQRIQPQDLPIPQLVEKQEQYVAYVRHQGYGRSIRLAWQTLRAWAAAEQRPFTRQLGLHHSNPAWVPLQHCRYVACLGIDEPIVRRGVVNSLKIPGGLHAAFELKGKYGELLPWMSKILEEWLPSSGLKMQTTPTFVEYHRNHFLEADEYFELTVYLPVSLL
jgi:AraC family transcriptional regulator